MHISPYPIDAPFPESTRHRLFLLIAILFLVLSAFAERLGNGAAPETTQRIARNDINKK